MRNNILQNISHFLMEDETITFLVDPFKVPPTFYYVLVDKIFVLLGGVGCGAC
jgi:hypothetical protein